MLWLSILPPATMLIVVAGRLWNRSKPDKNGEVRGIDWLFIRYTVIGVSLPLTGILALNGELTGESSTSIAEAPGYAFGKKLETPDWRREN